MWVMGGYGNVVGQWERNDVWYSTDGITWTQATAAAGWAARDGLGSVVYKNKMWVMGGSYLHDVWSSSSDIWNP